MNIIIASLRFAPGHIAHLIAYYQMVCEMGHPCVLWVTEQHEEFLQDFHVRTIHAYKEALEWAPDLIVAYNSAAGNLKLARIFKNRCRLLNVIHEPFRGLKGLLAQKKGSQIAKEAARNIIDFMTCRTFHEILLPSAQAEKLYIRYARFCNLNYRILPLLFPDLYTPGLQKAARKFFSFIGLFTAHHGNEDFLCLLHYIAAKKLDIPCKIATSTRIDSILRDPVIDRLIDSGQLVVAHGKPMTLQEINRHYAESVCVWNVYRNSTQSGVVGNSFMMGTPVIASRTGSFEKCVTEGKTGFFADDPTDFPKMLALYLQCKNSPAYFEKNCRASFFENFHYSAHKELFKRVFEGDC